MAHGLEVRVPLLDTQWAESIIGLPATLKINHRRGKHRRGKHIFRQALRPQLGDDIVNRRKKGFVPPLAQWCRGPLAEIARDAILAPNANINNWLDPTAVRRCWTRFHSHAEDRLAPRIWAILMLESWLKRHNANPTADPQPTLESVA
jgi:asparagine synthase (glutamine-hydrolysing)